MARAIRSKQAAAAALIYRVRALDCHAHLLAVTLEIARPSANQVVSLPVWIAGSYLVREFAKHLQHLHAQQGGAPAACTQLDKTSWRVHCRPDEPLILCYEIYAFDNSVRSAWLDGHYGFFNGTSVCLRVDGQHDAPHQLTLAPSDWPRGWRLATALMPGAVNPAGWGDYLAANYDELADSPVQMGNFWSRDFSAGGVPHRFVVTGAPASFDGARLLADAQTICQAEIAFWHGSAGSRRRRLAPHDRYVFLLNAVHHGYGGLEHRHSTALLCQRADLPQLGAGKSTSASDGYATLLGLISHEYFHTWCVKRLRPAEFTHYDYARENYTELLWFFEGFTSYYDDLLLRRAGLISDERYLQLLGKTINAVRQTPGRRTQSVAQASWDAWTKYYRPDENTVNATVSYYALGSLVALCLDLSLRQRAGQTLDDVMRALWQRCAGGPMTEADVLAVVAELSSASLSRQLTQWVHGTGDLPLAALLKKQGVSWLESPAALTDQLGLRVTESDRLRIKGVLRGSAAERAGLAAGDEWLGVEVGRGQALQAWRLNKLDDLPLYAGRARRCTAWVARDQRLLRLPLAWSATVMQVKLGVHDGPSVKRWLDAS